MTQKDRLYDIRMIFHAETDQAILVSRDEKERVWLPKSQIEYEMRTPTTVLVTMPEWLVIEKGLETHV